MHNSKRYCLLTVPVFLCSMFFCSGLFDDSTNLGAAIIENIDSNRVTISKHIREYVMDHSAVVDSFSLPGVNDTGFGVHAATNGYMVVGRLGNEQAAGYVQFICPPDTASSRTFASNDNLRKIIVRFSRNITIDTNTLPCRIEVWSSNNRSRALYPNPASGDSLLDTMQFVKAPQDSNNTATIPDSIELLPGLANDIFKACTTSTRGSSAKIFGFIAANIDTGLIRLNGNPQLIVEYTRGSDTTNKRYQTYSSWYTSYYLATDGAPDSLRRIPALSYASKRTAVFQYDATTLWATINGMANSQHAQVISAVFPLKGPRDKDTIKVRYLLLSYLENNGADLDSLFAANPSLPGVITIINTSRVLANVHQSLQNFSQNGRPSALYLYVRFDEDLNQKWNQTVWQNVPLLSAMIAVP